MFVDEKLATPPLRCSNAGGSGIAAISVIDNEMSISRGGLAEVPVYDGESCQFQRKIISPYFDACLFEMASCNINMCVYVSDWLNSVIRKVDVSRSRRTTVTKWSVANRPRCLSVNRAHNVLMASDRTKKIQEYTCSGSLIREIPESVGPWQAVKLSSGNPIVSRTGEIRGVSHDVGRNNSSQFRM